MSISHRVSASQSGEAERAIPYDMPSERAVLGAILLDRDAIVPIASWMKPEQFYLEKHALIYEAMLACYNRREPPDLATVAAELRRQEHLGIVGGLAYLGALAAEVPTAVHIEYYARSVVDTATRRRLIEAGGKITAIGYDEADGLEAALSDAEAELAAVSNRRGQTSYQSLRQIASNLFTLIEKAQDRRGELTGLATGYTDLDAITGGLQKADLIILAARPSVGKSAFAMSLAYNCAQRSSAHIGVFSLEMSRDQLMQRLLAMRTGIDMQRLRNGDLRDDELPIAFDGLGYLSELPIYIEDTAGISIGDLRARSRRMHAEVGLDLLIIDYLQLMTGGSGGRNNQNRQEEVSEISRGLKAIARELNVPVIALSQLSRAVEGRTNHKPMLSDLRESGSLEQDADIVWFIYRDELYDKETDKEGIAEIITAKHRNGPLGLTPLRFEPRTTQFQNLTRYVAPEGY